MGLVRLLPAIVLAFAAAAALMILTSRAAIEKLVGAGLLPRMFVNFVPVLTVSAKLLAIILIAVGGLQLGINSGLLSQEWLEKYGFSVLLIGLGIALLVLVGRGKKN